MKSCDYLKNYGTLEIFENPDDFEYNKKFKHSNSTMFVERDFSEYSNLNAFEEGDFLNTRIPVHSKKVICLAVHIE